MGYYTYFELDMKMEDGSSVPDTLVEQVRYSFNQIFDSDEDVDNFAEIYLDEEGGIEWKWYDDEKDMTELASLYPNIHFTIYGRGEDPDDRWIKDYLGNKKSIRYAEIIYPDLNW